VTVVRALDASDWELREALGDTWEWYVAKPIERRNSVTQAAGATAWLPARVPGSVVDDLVRAGEVREPRHGRRSREAEWVAERHWVYRRAVELPELGPRDQVWLEFDGVDPGGRVFWDGEQIARIEGLHRRHRVPVPRGTSTTSGPHTLAVVVDPGLDTEPQVGRTERVRRLAPRVDSGWDFAPRLRHQGIWRSARLITGPGSIASVRARTTVDLPSRSGAVLVDVQLDGWTDAWPDVRAEVSLDGGTVATATAPPSASGALRLQLEVADVALWWPAGMGAQPLYDVRVAAAGDERSLRVGFREARLVANTGAPDGALAYTGQVNGRVIPLVGWNWAPVDVMFGTVDVARTRHLVELAADSGARLLRVWGGGLIESDDFYDECDERGLLVWQELSQSSSGMQSAPADDEAFIAHAVEETLAAAARLARHPSLFLWCGGNELEDDAGPLDERRSPVLAAMRDALTEADPDRSWLPTSPSGPTFHHRLDRITADPDGQHDVHGPWEHQGLEGQYRLANAGTNLAHTEFGVEGMASLRSLRAIIPAESLWPADRSNPVYRHLGEWWNNAELVSASFGGRLDSLERMQRASQWLQATGLQYAIEADRRRWPRCSMVLPWQLAESFPNAWCTSAVEWSGEAKPALHAARRAFDRDRVTIRVSRAAWEGAATMTAEAWVWSESGMPAGSTVRLVLRDAAGTILAERESGALRRVGIPARATILDIPRPEADPIVLWEAQWTAPDGSVIDVERMAATLTGDFAPLLELEAAEVAVHAREDGDTWRVRVAHTGGPAVIAPVLHDARPWRAPGRFIARDDPRPLLPGESRELEVRWVGVPTEGRALSLDAFNLSPLPVTTTGRSISS
jgi:beta-mannosidase